MIDQNSIPDLINKRIKNWMEYIDPQAGTRQFTKQMQTFYVFNIH